MKEARRLVGLVTVAGVRKMCRQPQLKLDREFSILLLAFVKDLFLLLEYILYSLGTLLHAELFESFGILRNQLQRFPQQRQK